MTRTVLYTICLGLFLYAIMQLGGSYALDDKQVDHQIDWIIPGTQSDGAASNSYNN